MARRSIPIQKPRSWVGILLWAVGGAILIKAFWPAGDAKLASVAGELKKAVNQTGSSSASPLTKVG